MAGKLKLYFFSVFALVSLLLVFGFQNPESDYIRQLTALLDQYNKTNAQEKIYVHLDKPYYVAGEDIWFKAYLVNASGHMPDSVSRNIYVELISGTGKVVERNILKVKAGSAAGDFTTSDSLTAGTYTLRAYTNWMRNFPEDFFFTQELEIYNKSLPDADITASTKITPVRNASNKPVKITAQPAAQAIDAEKPIAVQFFPESGNLIYTIESKVGFKAVNPLGQAESISGVITEESGLEVVTFTSNKLGMGSFIFLPEIGKTYWAKVKSRYGLQTFSLPVIQEKGIVMKINNLEKDIKINLVQNIALPESPKELVLVGQVRNRIYYSATFRVKSSPFASLFIPRTKFPTGIIHFTLFDAQTKEPLCERLCFNQTIDQLQLTVKASKIQYQKREKVELEITAADADGNPVQTDLSLAVTEAGVKADPYSQNIMNYLLLSSDLKGNIEQPGFYFKDDSLSTKIALDNLLLTQGWRRFVWKEVMTNIPPNQKYAPENGLSVSGQIHKTGTKIPAADSKVIVTVLGKESELAVLKTNEAGRFQVGDLNFYGSANVLVQGENQKGKPFVTITLDELKPPHFPVKPVVNWPSEMALAANKKAKVDAEYLKKVKDKLKYDEAFTLGKDGGLLLTTVDVKGKRGLAVRLLPTPRQRDLLLPVTKEMGQSPNIIRALLGKVPHLKFYVDPEKLQNPPLDGNIYAVRLETYRGDPLFFINGFSVELSTILVLNPEDIESVEVLRESHPSVYGFFNGHIVPSTNGAINILLKKGASGYSRRQEGIAYLKKPGFYKAREFYSPTYDIPKEEHSLPDKRTTLYWHPSIKTDANGKASVTFYNADEVTGLHAVLEGISLTGLVGSKSQMLGPEK